MAKNQKFKVPVFARGRRAAKHTEHDAKWLDTVVGNVKAGTDPKVKASAPISYHGIAPHVQDDLSAPIEARPSSIYTEPADVPAADDQTRKLEGGNVPTHPNTKGATPGPKVPMKCG